MVEPELLSAPATSPWRSGRVQPNSAVEVFVASREPVASTALSVVELTPAIRTTAPLLAA